MPYIRGAISMQLYTRHFASWHFYTVTCVLMHACTDGHPMSCRLLHRFVCLLQVKILSSLITAVLPGIVLTIFLALLPALLALLNKKVQKMVSETDIEFGVVRKYFVFQVCCCCCCLAVLCLVLLEDLRCADSKTITALPHTAIYCLSCCLHIGQV